MITCQTLRVAIVFMLWNCLIFAASAQEPPASPIPEQFPAPKVIVPAPAPPVIYDVPHPVVMQPFPMPPRMDTRNAWAYFLPNQYGQMRPRVVLAPQGAYYLSNGQVYPFTTVFPRYYYPRASD